MTPGMSVAGVLGALTYAAPKLEELRERWVEIADDQDDLPDVARGGSWSSGPRDLRCAYRVHWGGAPGHRKYAVTESGR
jgi:formylglycine-generating enzyme required for sulfatase activity